MPTRCSRRRCRRSPASHRSSIFGAQYSGYRAPIRDQPTRQPASGTTSAWPLPAPISSTPVGTMRRTVAGHLSAGLRSSWQAEDYREHRHCPSRTARTVKLGDVAKIIDGVKRPFRHLVQRRTFAGAGHPQAIRRHYRRVARCGQGQDPGRSEEQVPPSVNVKRSPDGFLGLHQIRWCGTSKKWLMILAVRLA